MTQTTDIPEYGQFIKAKAQESESAVDIVADAVKTLALQLRAEAQSLAQEPDADRAAQIEWVEEDLRRAQAEFADPRGHAVRNSSYANCCGCRVPARSRAAASRSAAAAAAAASIRSRYRVRCSPAPARRCWRRGCRGS